MEKYETTGMTDGLGGGKNKERGSEGGTGVYTEKEREGEREEGWDGEGEGRGTKGTKGGKEDHVNYLGGENSE